MNLARIRKAVNKIAPSVTVEEWRGCVRLTGECDDWATIYKCGKAAVDKRSLGVINDVKLKGFHEEPKKPTLKDGAIDGQKPDVLVIGGGIAGCAVLRELSRLDLDVLLVERQTTWQRARPVATTVVSIRASTFTKDNKNSNTFLRATSSTSNLQKTWDSNSNRGDRLSFFRRNGKTR